MIKIHFPKNKVEIRSREGINEVLDGVRKKWIVLTPEEWVRQNFLQYLFSLNYPGALMAVEKEIRLGELKKRCDIVIYDRTMAPWMIVECKEMGVHLTENTIQQILTYHQSIPCKYLIITNGAYTFGFEKTNDAFYDLFSLPDFPENY